MTLVGAIGLNMTPANIVREAHTTTTSDGVTISFNVYYESNIPKNRPIIIIGHGVFVNKEMMTNYAMELAARDFVVASLDWRGHGQSGGTLDTSKLRLDLDAVIAAIPGIMPSANMSNLGLIGYSMGGLATFPYAASHPNVKAWVGVGTTPNGTISNTTNPRNALVVVGTLDEGFSIQEIQGQMVNMTGATSANAVQTDYLYGNISKGTAREIDVIPFADHLAVPWDSRFITAATDWIVRTFDNVVPDQTFTVYNERLILLIVGLIGLVGLIYGVSLILARVLKIAKEGDDANVREQETTVDAEMTGKQLVISYYAWSLLLIPTAIIPGLTFFLPLFVTSFVATLVATLAINIFLLMWRYLKKRGISLLQVMKANLAGWRIWLLSIAIAAIFIVGFYFIVGLNYLGVIPSVSRAGYIPIYGVIMFLSYLIYAIFNNKILEPFLDRKITMKNEKIRYILKSLVIFLLLYSWFFITIMLLYAASVALFPFVRLTILILIMMAPFFLFGSFGMNYLQRLTGSSLPNVLLQIVFLTPLIVTLSPLGSLMSMMMP